MPWMLACHIVNVTHWYEHTVGWIFHCKQSLKVNRPNLHFRCFQRILMSFPSRPDDPIYCCLVLIIVISIQVGLITGEVPPSTFTDISTTEISIRVIIHIFSGKSHVFVISKWVPSIACLTKYCRIINIR